MFVQSEERLAAVRTSRLLDTEPEEDFDSLTRLAKATLDAAASFVSIVDTGRDFYKSQAGFPEPLASTRELAGRTFCHNAIAGPGPLIIGDTLSDPDWRAVPTVKSLGVRAYLGVPIVLDGQPIGSFCVIDAKPREWSASEIEIATQLALSASREIRLRAALSRMEAEATRLRALARSNEEVMSVVAHDLRSPLQAMGLTATMLGRSEDAAIQGHARRMTLAVETMRCLVDDLLASQALDVSVQQRRQTVTAAKLLDDAAQTMGLIASRAKVAIVPGPVDEVSVHIDYAQMLRVLCNVIGNCIKYCPGSTVGLTARTAPGTVVLTVSDNGPGISAADLPRVFERGFQGSNGQALSQGEGLGLAIVRSLVEQNGGTVSLSSLEGAGTMVAISLPC